MSPKGFTGGVPHRPPRQEKFHKKVRALLIAPGPSTAYVPLTKKQWAVIDTEDAAWVGQWNWYAHWSHTAKNFRAMRAEYRDDGTIKWIAMHSALLRLEGRAVTADHIDPNRSLDNRRANLRPASATDQARNRRRFVNNRAGAKCVQQRKSGKWTARIQVKGKRFNLGTFDTAEAAQESYCKACQTHFGDFARPE